jgi:hypothetical protein
MNEYNVTVRENDNVRVLLITAETLARARDQLPDDTDVIDIKFVRATGFSCRPRGLRSR